MTKNQWSLVGGIWVLSLIGSSVCLGQGAIVSAGGPVHRGMGGASTAAPVSALGALYWNPATISGLNTPNWRSDWMSCSPIIASNRQWED